MDINKILVPTDFSDCSETAISFALEMAIDFSAHLYLMHSQKSPFSMASERLVELIMNNERFQGVKTSTLTEIGDPGPSILRQSKEVQADVLIMGSKGSSGSRNFLGSTTAEVISQSNVPVLAVPQNNTYSGFEDIVFMTDFKEGDVPALKDMLDWARHFNAALHVLHLFTDDSFRELIIFRGFREVAKERLDYDKLSFERVFNSTLDEGFFDYMKTRNPQLVVLTRYQKTLFQKMTEKDHARQIGHQAMTPFLTLHGERYLQGINASKKE